MLDGNQCRTEFDALESLGQRPVGAIQVADDGPKETFEFIALGFGAKTGAESRKPAMTEVGHPGGEGLIVRLEPVECGPALAGVCRQPEGDRSGLTSAQPRVQ